MAEIDQIDRIRDGIAAGTPLLSLLPYRGYQNNPTAQALTAGPDDDYTTVSRLLEQLPALMDPYACPVEWLEWRAYLVALSGDYWDNGWTEGTKRALIAAAPDLWSQLGTLETIRRVLDTHGIPHKVWTDGSLTVPFEFPGVFGGEEWVFFIQLDIRYARSSPEFREAERTLRNFGPAGARSRVTYDHFYPGYSAWDDPMFSGRGQFY